MTDFLLLSFIFLVAGVLSVPIASRLGLGSVLGYLIAGIVISPLLSLLGVDLVSIQHFAEFGVVMMLFLVGLELEPKMLWSMRGRLLGLGGGQIVLTTAVIMLIAMSMGQPWHFALAIGLVLALSSTAIVLQTLNEKGLMRSDGGQASFSVLLFQDIAVIPILALLPLLAMPELMADFAAGTSAGHGPTAYAGTDHGGGGHSSGMSLVAGLNGWQTAAVNIAAIAAVILGGNYLARPLFRFVAAAQLRELFTALALLVVVGIALLMTLVGLSPALGTFLAGVVLANSEYRHELEADIDPFRGLLLGLFFITVGAGMNFLLMFENITFILACTAGLILLKGAILLLLARIFNVAGADKWLFALGLAQAGEFGFVLVSFTTSGGILPDVLGDQLLLIITLSMLITPLLFIFYEKVIVTGATKGPAPEADEITEQSPIIIAGCGRMGGIINNMLVTAGYQTTVIDYSSKQLEALRKINVPVFFGDATRPDLLEAAGINKAKLLIVAIDNKDQITELVKHMEAHHPKVHVIARAVDRSHVFELWYAGCRDIIRETYDGSKRISRSAFEALGIEREKAQAMVDVMEEMDRGTMRETAEHYIPGMPWHENEAMVKRIREMREPWRAEVRKRLEEILK
ncbi:cation:proton antiporter [Parvularcula sp. IMCC14364]|uniref:cation:proton antiporter domain-containing protein n=1 Tax=Parvularcula sp. IMCC14364 TaxID=3067902 RepID=UPI0027427FCF|nr:cation:proton antiporter [Parvularcula sp. IMCC14364]